MADKNITVTYYDMKDWVSAYFKCDNCQVNYIESHFLYCANCGNKIDWEESGID
jgi:hypothetical protein